MNNSGYFQKKYETSNDAEIRYSVYKYDLAMVINTIYNVTFVRDVMHISFVE